MVQYIFPPWLHRRELLAVRRLFYPEHHHQNNHTQTQTQTKPRSQSRTRTYINANNKYGPISGNHQPAASSVASQGEVKQKQEAVARVSVWMQRGGCPHMVESTALLTAAILSEREIDGFGGGGGSGGVEDSGWARASRGYAVRAAYSAAFSRFVTGLLDSHQDKQRKMSMYDVAKSVGLPATFVELRHQATHEQLPSLTRLRGAAHRALAWIWEYYWRGLADVPDSAVEEDCSRSPKDIVGGMKGEEESGLRGLLGRYLGAEGENEGVKREIMRGFDEREVLMELDSIAETTKNGGVLRRAMALTREILEGEVEGESERMEEDEKLGDDGMGKDVEIVRAELGKAWEVVNEAEEVSMAEAEESVVEVDVVEEQPGWELYEKDAWVPKPIGVV